MDGDQPGSYWGRGGSCPQTYPLPPGLCHTYMYMWPSLDVDWSLYWRSFHFASEASGGHSGFHKRTEIVANGHRFLLQNIPKWFCGRGSAPDHTWKLTVSHSHRPPSWTLRPLLDGEGKWRIKKEGVGRKREARIGRRGDWSQKGGLGVFSLKSGHPTPDIIGWLRA